MSVDTPEKPKPFVEQVQRVDRSTGDVMDAVGNFLVELFHRVALFTIGAINAWAAVHSIIEMAHAGKVNLDDILLLFIYLEIGAMVGIYFKTHHMPVRYLIYVAMTALTRLLISDAGMHHDSIMDLLIISGSVLVLSASVFILRYGTFKYPSETKKIREG